MTKVAVQGEEQEAGCQPDGSGQESMGISES